jgi:DNA-binding transcriptional ArsR family regulator
MVTYGRRVRAERQEDDLVFKALADPGRRVLLDALFETDGQSLHDLCAVLPELTRFGVMKHLTLLEQAGLVVTFRDGRRKLHYLNPLPIQRAHDRWISKYSAVSMRALTELHVSVEPGA